MRVWVITYRTIELIVCGYESADEALSAAIRTGYTQSGAQPIVEEVTGPAIIMRELDPD